MLISIPSTSNSGVGCRVKLISCALSPADSPLVEARPPGMTLADSLTEMASGPMVALPGDCSQVYSQITSPWLPLPPDSLPLPDALEFFQLRIFIYTSQLLINKAVVERNA